MGKIKDAVQQALDQRVLDAEVARRLAIIDGYGADREDGAVLKFEKALPVGPAFEPGQVVTSADFNRMMAEAVSSSFNWSYGPAVTPAPTPATGEDGRVLKTYTYVALRAGDRWFLSGPKESGAGKSHTWAELCLWLAGDGEPVTELVELVPVVPVAQQAPRPAGTPGEVATPE